MKSIIPRGKALICAILQAVWPYGHKVNRLGKTKKGNGVKGRSMADVCMEGSMMLKR